MKPVANVLAFPIHNKVQKWQKGFIVVVNVLLLHFIFEQK